MGYLIFKYLVTSAIVITVSEVARHSSRFAALIAALPLVTTLTLVWLHTEEQPPEKIVEFSLYTFWYVLPTLPMFWIFAKCYVAWGFWPALLAACLSSSLLFFVLMRVLESRGIHLL
ncbi:MAG: DUF3147 family protein [Methylococcus sp.]